MDKNSPRSFKFKPKFRIGELVEVKCVYIDRDNLELVRNQISKYVVSIRISAELSQISVEQSLEYLLSDLNPEDPRFDFDYLVSGRFDNPYYPENQISKIVNNSNHLSQIEPLKLP